VFTAWDTDHNERITQDEFRVFQNSVNSAGGNKAIGGVGTLFCCTYFGLCCCVCTLGGSLACAAWYAGLKAESMVTAIQEEQKKAALAGPGMQ
jgi:hypothetical protein